MLYFDLKSIIHIIHKSACFIFGRFARGLKLSFNTIEGEKALIQLYPERSYSILLSKHSFLS